jgi:subtilisin family serine protease
MAEPQNRHRHLQLTRAEPINQRRTGGGFGPKRPADPGAHARQIRDALDEVLATPVAEAGFDPRRLLKLEVEGLEPDAFESIDGLQVVSQEKKSIVVLFASDEGQREFRRRLDLLSRGRQPTRQDILFAVKGVSEWGPDDRIGPALRVEGLPESETFVLDVELWPLERKGSSRDRMLRAFGEWCAAAAATTLDTVNQDSIALARLRISMPGYDRLLNHRDVRLVDLPPRLQLAASDLQVDVDTLGEMPQPPSNAVHLAVLDSGITSNHPLLEAVVGDAQSFVPQLGAADEHGHGTAVAGLASYGDIAACLRTSVFVPRFRILSGRITDAENASDSGFVENHITAAVKYFVEEYDCRIFNLSFGDSRKPFDGGHVRGLAVTIDTLARSHDVLFIVSAGNYVGNGQAAPPKWKTDYPSYLLDREEARIIDPAPALNALTVGSIARFESPRLAQRYPSDPAFQAVARTDQPSPFSRTGPGPGGALKPEIVEYGGNYAVDLRDASESFHTNALLGEPAPAFDFAARGGLLRDFVGTSFAAPHAAHLAARVLEQYPGASSNLVRALIVAHAVVPEPAKLIARNEAERRRLVGYGRPRAERCVHSLDNCVSLVVDEKLGEDQHHFFAIPLPEDFLEATGSRLRTITVALAHRPLVRTTRFDYRGSRMKFRVVAAKNLDEVTKVFKKTPKDEREEAMAEFRKPGLGAQTRDKGTVQSATYEVKRLDAKAKQKQLFVVVTRLVPSWAQGWSPQEPYALVVVLEDHSEQRVRYYQQLVEIQQRQRVRVRA